MFTARLITLSLCLSTRRIIATFIKVDRTVTYERNAYGMLVPMMRQRVAAFPVVIGSL